MKKKRVRNKKNIDGRVVLCEFNLMRFLVLVGIIIFLLCTHFGVKTVTTAITTNKVEFASSSTKDLSGSTALYITNLIYQPSENGYAGTDRETVVENILYLLDSYDYVDFIVVDSDGSMQETFTKNTTTKTDIGSCLENIETEMGTDDYCGTSGILKALMTYLFGNTTNKTYTESNLVNDPDLIYLAMYIGIPYYAQDTYCLEQTVDIMDDGFFEFMMDYFGEKYKSAANSPVVSASGADWCFSGNTGGGDTKEPEYELEIEYAKCLLYLCNPYNYNKVLPEYEWREWQGWAQWEMTVDESFRSNLLLFGGVT